MRIDLRRRILAGVLCDGGEIDFVFEFVLRRVWDIRRANHATRRDRVGNRIAFSNRLFKVRERIHWSKQQPPYILSWYVLDILLFEPQPINNIARHANLRSSHYPVLRMDELLRHPRTTTLCHQITLQSPRFSHLSRKSLHSFLLQNATMKPKHITEYRCRY